MNVDCAICSKKVALNGLLIYNESFSDPSDGSLIHKECRDDFCNIGQSVGINLDDDDWLMVELSQVSSLPGMRLRLGLGSESRHDLAKELISSLSKNRPPELSYIYIIAKKGTSLYKIGKSDRPKIRLSSLRQTFTNIEIVHTIATKQGLALQLEKTLHSLFSDHHTKEARSMGLEWFALEQEDVDWLKSLEFIDSIPHILNDGRWKAKRKKRTEEINRFKLEDARVWLFWLFTSVKSPLLESQIFAKGLALGLSEGVIKEARKELTKQGFHILRGRSKNDEIWTHIEGKES